MKTDTPLVVPRRRVDEDGIVQDVAVAESQSRCRRSLSPKRRGRRTLASPMRSSSSHHHRLQHDVIVRQPSKRRLLMLERANSAPNLFQQKNNARRPKRTSKTKGSNINSSRRRRTPKKSVSAKCHSRDNSLHNARQPRRNSNANSNANENSLGRWEHPQGVERRLSNTSNASRPDRSIDRSSDRSIDRSNSTCSIDSLPQKPKRNQSPEPIHHKDKQNHNCKQPIRTPDQDHDDDDDDSTEEYDDDDDDDDENSFALDNNNQKQEQKEKEKQNKPAATRTTKNTEKKIDIKLLGYTDLEEIDDNQDLFLPPPPPPQDKQNKMNHRLSIGSTMSTKSNRSANTFAPTASSLFQSRRESMGNRNLPVRASSFLDTYARPNSNSNSNNHKHFANRRRNRSMDMTLNLVTGTSPMHMHMQFNRSSTHSRNSRNSRRPSAATGTGATTTTTNRQQMQSFSSVVLGGRNSKSFRLQRPSNSNEDAARRRQQQRRCRSMDMTPSVVKRAPSPPPLPKRQQSNASSNTHVADSSFNCDVSDVMASLARDEDEEMSFFTLASSSSSGGTTRPGSVASRLSFHSVGSSHHNNSTGCHSFKQAPQRGRLSLSPSTDAHKKACSLSPARISMKKTPNNIVDLIENMDSEEGEYIIFVGNKKDLTSVDGGGDDDDDDYNDDNSTYLSIGGLSLGVNSAGFCSCHSSFRNITNGSGSHSSLGYRVELDSNKDDTSNPSLGYRDPDNQDRKIAGCLHCSSHEHEHKHDDNKDDDNDSQSEESEVHSDEEWSQSDKSSSGESNGSSTCSNHSSTDSKDDNENDHPEKQQGSSARNGPGKDSHGGGGDSEPKADVKSNSANQEKVTGTSEVDGAVSYCGKAPSDEKLTTLPNDDDVSSNERQDVPSTIVMKADGDDVGAGGAIAATNHVRRCEIDDKNNTVVSHDVAPDNVEAKGGESAVPKCAMDKIEKDGSCRSLLGRTLDSSESTDIFTYVA
ncbi:expressed unknown protein [Seminavis robusta]|uniref:Uncharacterized protein n=1 Tax=Seminavis robusta TaxID=568900 RepID=A0A9N8HBA6_9STRA|nr:expressed unknown protein [Seminavis robusta]|eukprot:Sro270_g104210.1 n/a (979) ;mRNA; f:25790-28726